jgi:hypothetical protein
MADRPTDRFGLPVPPLGPETAKQRLSRQAQVRWHGKIALGQLFAALKVHLGLDEARRIFGGFSKSGPRQGRGSADPDWDVKLLDLYDLAAESTNTMDMKSLPRKIAEHVRESEPNKFGYTDITATAVHIRRLLQARERRRIKDAAERAEHERQLRAQEKIIVKNRRLHDSRTKSRNK